MFGSHWAVKALVTTGIGIGAYYYKMLIDDEADDRKQRRLTKHTIRRYRATTGRKRLTSGKKQLRLVSGR